MPATPPAAPPATDPATSATTSAATLTPFNQLSDMKPATSKLHDWPNPHHTRNHTHHKLGFSATTGLIALAACITVGTLMGVTRAYTISGSTNKASSHSTASAQSDTGYIYATLRFDGDRVTLFEADRTTQLISPTGSPTGSLTNNGKAHTYTGRDNRNAPRRDLPNGYQARSVTQRNDLASVMNILDQEGWQVVTQLPSSTGSQLLLRQPR